MRSQDIETAGELRPQPASRLRRALDLARMAADSDSMSPAVAPMEAGDPVPLRTAPALSPKPERLRTIGSVLAPDPNDAQRRRGTGRGLDALIPAASEGPGSIEEAWVDSTQGWVRSDAGALQWRPIVTTTHVLDHWKVDTYLGLVSGQAMVDSGTADARLLAAARRDAVEAMVADAVARGAHGVIGVAHEIDPFGSNHLLSATGTAVTLVHRD